MKRVFVTGNAGSGKSTLAVHIAKLLDLPCHSLDRIVWQSGWTKRPSEERDSLIHDVAASDLWVIDGVSDIVLCEADTIVFLDVPRRVSYWRTFKRNLKYLFRSRPELPPRCPEIKITPVLWRIIWNFPSRIRPQIVSHIESSDMQTCFHLKTGSDHREFMKHLKVIRG